MPGVLGQSKEPMKPAAACQMLRKGRKDASRRVVPCLVGPGKTWAWILRDLGVIILSVS